jgi:drug/metabolite transporter (DMT)-like permease
MAEPSTPGAGDGVLLMLFGTLQFGLGLLLLTLGARRISATRSALISGVEVPLAVLWVWLAFQEAPPAMTWAGGGGVMAAVLFDLWAGERGR